MPVSLRSRVIAGLLTPLTVGAVGLAACVPAGAAAATSVTSTSSSSLLSVPISGTASNATFSGVFTLTNFVVNQAGQLVANGSLTGTLTDTAGNLLGTVTNQPVALPVTGAQATGSCQILNLTLGPLDLNLLGLMVHLDQVHLTITAQRGPNNLLGNLLCAVAGLLNGSGGSGVTLAGITALLNSLIGAL